jgi:hypothetical protein
MSVAPANTSSVLVSVSGVLQTPSTYSVSGTTLTFSSAPPAGTGNISVRYLGIPASGVTTTAYRTQTEFTATAGQTTFTPPSYTVGFIDVYRNGVKLGTSDFTATTGTTVVLATGASSGDLVTTVSFLVSSVLNAIPNTAASVSNTNLVPLTTLPVSGSNTLTVPAVTGTMMVSGNMPAFSAYNNGNSTAVSATTWTKITFNTEDFDTNNNFDSTTNYRFTPTVSGYYQINLFVLASQSGAVTTNINAAIYKNGSIYRGVKGTSVSGEYVTVSYCAIIYFNGSTDYIEGYMYGGSSCLYYGSASTGNGGANSNTTNISGVLVRSA